MWIDGWYGNATNFLCVLDIQSFGHRIIWVPYYYCFILLWAPLTYKLSLGVKSRSGSIIPLLLGYCRDFVFISEVAEFGLCINMIAWAQVTFVARAIWYQTGFL